MYMNCIRAANRLRSLPRLRKGAPVLPRNLNYRSPWSLPNPLRGVVVSATTMTPVTPCVRFARAFETALLAIKADMLRSAGLPPRHGPDPEIRRIAECLAGEILIFFGPDVADDPLSGVLDECFPDEVS